MARKRLYTDEERLQRKRASNKRWHKNNPTQAKVSDKKQYDKQYAANTDKIKKRNSDWQKENLEWRRQYLKDWRARKKAEQ